MMRPLSEFPASALAKVRVLAADVDDTVTLHGKIPASTLEWFEALDKAGIVIALVTGRPAGWAQALASYLPGIALAVAENGLVVFDGAGQRRDLGPPRGNDFFPRLAKESAQVKRAFALEVTPDDAFRLFERSFLRPTSFDAAALANSQALVSADFEVMASSIHIHVRPRGFGKAEGLLEALRPVAPEACAEPDSAIVFVGDSSNDRSLFARLRQSSVGVANVVRFLDELGGDCPAYVTRGEGARGFAELANALIAARGG